MHSCMKRIVTLLAAVAVIFSCEISEPIRPYDETEGLPAYTGDLNDVEWSTFVFSSEDIADKSKTEHYGNTIYWSAGDQIRMGYTVAGRWQGASGNATSNSPAKLYASDALASGGETASFSVPGQFPSTGSGEYKFYTVYPAEAVDENFSSAPSTIVTIPTEQTPAAASFDPAADIMVGHSVRTYNSKPTEDIPLVWDRLVAHGEITLKNLTSISGFSADETIQSVTLTAQSSAYLTGSYNLNISTPAIVSSNSASNSVTVSGGNLSWDNGTLTFWIGILPVTITSLDVSLETDAAIYTRSFSGFSREFLVNTHNKLGINMASATRTSKFNYLKVEEDLFDWSGEYVLGYDNGTVQKMLTGISTTSTKYGIATDVNITNNVIPYNVGNPYKITIEKSGESYTMSFGGKYLAWNSGNSLILSDSATSYQNGCKWTFSYNNGVLTITNGNTAGRTLKYNTQNPRFACYESGQSAPSLYKLSDTSGTPIPPDPQPGATATVTTTAASSVAQTTATLNGSFGDNTGEISEVGFKWGTSQNNLDQNGTVSGVSSPSSFHLDISSLIAGTTYYFQAYVKEFNALTNSVEERLGSVLSFTTEAEPQTVTQYVKVTSEPSNWNGTYLLVYEETSTSGRVCTAGVDAASNYVTATISSSVILADNLSDYEVEIATYSTGYSIKALGGTNANKYLEGQGSSSNGTSFAASPSLVTTLVLSDGVVTITNNSNVFAYNSAANNYRWRFFKSTTASGNGYYKPALYLKSGSATPQVTVTTSAASNITSTSAKLNGSYVVPTGLSVTERGFFYGTTNNPSGKITVSGTGTSFSTTLTGLSEGTTYFFKAYAIESNGTYRYGEVMSFTASTPSALPKHLGCYEIPAIGTVSNAAEGYEVLPSEQDATDNNPRTKWLRWDTGNSNQKIVTHTFWNSHVSPNKTMRSYTLLQDFDKKCALWVACSMNNDVYPQKVSRSEKWCYDPALPNSWQPNLTSSYPNKNGLSYDRGHQLAASYRETTTNQVKMTCYFTNMTPQLSSLNQGVWQSTVEANIRSLGAATSGRDTLYVVSGPLFIGSYDTVEDKDGLSCAKPTHYFQCFMKVSFNSSGVPQSAKGAAYLVEHTASPNVQYKTIDYIESLAGFDFFANVPSAIQNAAESTATPYDQF